METMNNRLRRFGLFGALVLLTTSGASAQTGVETPTYVNAQVVSIDPARRTLVIVNSKGQKTSMVFDDLLAGTGAIKAGDKVIVTVRGGPGRQRVSGIRLARTTSAASPTPGTAQPAPVSERARAREAFARQVASVSQSASGVDASWASFVTACKVIQPETMSGGRDWFGLWDGRVQADYSGGFCRDLFNQIVSAGEGVKKSMAAAESAISGLLDPGEIRDIRTLHNMNWDGWTLPPPARRDP
jgi:hypothetical protein